MEKNPSLLYIAFSHIHVSFKMVAQKHAQFQLVVSRHSHVHLCTKHIGLSVLCSSSSQDCLKMSSRKTSLDHLSLNFVCNDVSYCVLYRGTCLCIVLWEIVLMQPYCPWDEGVCEEGFGCTGYSEQQKNYAAQQEPSIDSYC